jgi:lipoprotein-releasing system permease protein
LFNKVERLISSRNLRPKKKEGFLKIISIFSFLGIMLGVAILIIVMSVMNGFRTDLTNKILGLNPHIVVNPSGTIIDDEFKTLIKNKFKKIVLRNSYNGEGVLIKKDFTKGIVIKSLDNNDYNNSKFLIGKIIKGDFKNFKKGSILVGSELALSLDLQIGDNINLMSTSFVNTPLGSVPKQESYKIIGMFKSGFFQFDENIVFLNIEDVLSLFNKEEKDLSLEVYLKDPIKADTYKKEIEKFNKNYFIYSWTDLNKSFFSALKVERNVMFIILALIIIVAAFNIISGLTILIKNKTREIAILKSLGLSSISIKKSFFLTGMTIGFLASITGVILGVLFSIYIENIRIFFSSIFNLQIFPPEVYFLDKMPSELNFISIFIIFIFSITITALASYFPARSISKMETTRALKYE